MDPTCKTQEKANTQSGFTLIELLLYVSIVGSLLTAVVMFFAATVDSRVKTQSISEVNQQGTAVMEYITHTIRDATSVTSPVAGGAAAQSLTLVVADGNLSPTVFELNGTAFQVRENTDTPVITTVLTNNKVTVSDLSFKNLSRSGTPGVVHISFKLSRVNASGRNEYDYQKTFTSSAALRWP